MKAAFYKELQINFASVRFLCRDKSPTEEPFLSTISAIKEARKTINLHSPRAEKAVLLYCIDTLFAILQEGDPQKAFDYADTIHNIPEIYMQKRNLYSFSQELKRFQKKYGKHYFPFIDEVKPHFSKKAPKNKWEFFFAESDATFKLLHPRIYKLLCGVGVLALLLPQILYVAYVVFIHPAPNEWPMLLGYVGTFILGIGLFNIVAAWIHQYLGHLLTAVCLLAGTALTLFSLHLLYT